jgi:DNA-directed RNA polymerases I, II, and III subunit RPABC1
MERAYEICLEMICQRNYEIIDRDDERILARKPNKEEMCVFLTNTSKFNVENIKEYIHMMRKMELNHSIIVYKDNVTPVAKKIIDDTKEFKIELFHVDDMQYNITKHYLVPKHEIHCKKGTPKWDEFKKKYSDNFPVILRSDPISRFYDYDKNDIIKITDSDGFVSFRIVK